MATLVLGAIGTLVGGPLGGAIGATLGRGLDREIIGNGRREGPRLTELAVSTSSSVSYTHLTLPTICSV